MSNVSDNIHKMQFRANSSLDKSWFHQYSKHAKHYAQYAAAMSISTPYFADALENLEATWRPGPRRKKPATGVLGRMPFQ